MPTPFPVRKVLQIHNRYLAGLGGEDSVVESDRVVLESAGVSVVQLIESTEDADVSGPLKKIVAARDAVWSKRSFDLVKNAVARHKPDLVHVHNTFVRLSPSVFHACEGVPVVATLHNYRYVCANALLFRDNAPCEECLDGSPWSGLRHRCYRGSLAGSATLSAINSYHRSRGTWQNKIDAFICFSQFNLERLARGGFPAGKGFVMDQAVDDSGISRTVDGSDFVFLGRMAEEKGPDIVLDAWLSRPPSDARLHMIGDGTMLESLRSRGTREDVFWHGRLDRSAFMPILASARALVVASRCYETGPLSVLEALSLGTPAIVPRLGPMPSRINEGEAGWTFNPLDIADLARVLATAQDDPLWEKKSWRAREIYLERHTPSTYLAKLSTAYQQAIDTHSQT